jgi:L-alanine-DL-glutamate epimerase-like enolase superfamily enzyme
MQISRIQIAECRIPLPKVLTLGTTQIRTRDFVALRIETDSGVAGEALGYTRGTPVYGALELVAHRALGRDPLMRGELTSGLQNSNVPGRASFPRAISLLDIACWDILAKSAELPLFRLLGGLRREVGATAVAGYYMDLRTIADINDEVEKLFDCGYSRVKFMLNGNDPDFDRAYVAAVTKDPAGPVAADAHWSWATLTEAKRFCRDLDGFGLDFLEDPFAASDLQLTHELQKGLATPIAAGEDVLNTRALCELIGGIGILRVDATTCGGISGAVEAIHHANGAGKSVLPHVWAPLHVHLACAFPWVEGVEVVPEYTGADPLEQLLSSLPRLQDGKFRPSEEPGAGIVLNWEAVEKAAHRATTISEDR